MSSITAAAWCSPASKTDRSSDSATWRSRRPGIRGSCVTPEPPSGSTIVVGRSAAQRFAQCHRLPRIDVSQPGKTRRYAQSMLPMSPVSSTRALLRRGQRRLDAAGERLADVVANDGPAPRVEYQLVVQRRITDDLELV